MGGDLNNNQFGFRQNIGTRKSNLSPRIMIEKQILQIKETFIAFVDLENHLIMCNGINYLKL